MQRRKIESLLQQYHIDGKRLLYEGKTCVTRKSMPKIQQMAHDAKASGHFGFLKTMSRLNMFHSKQKSRDVRNYVRGCLTY